MTRHRTQLGMSLIELVLVLALSALLLSLCLPSLGTFIANQRVTTASNSLIAHLQFARQTAITRVQPVIACPSTDARECEGNRWDSGWIVFIDSDRNGRLDDSDELLRVVQTRERIRIHSGGRHRVRFQPTGGAYGSNLTLRVCPVERDIAGRAVIVSNPGRVRAQRRLDPAECEP